MANEELLLAMSDMMDAKLKPIHVKLDKMDRRLGKVEKRLGSLESRVGRVEESVIRLEERVGGLESRVGSLESKAGTLEHRVKRIEVDLLENNVVPRLNTIEAYYVETSKRYQESTDHMEAVRTDVSVLKLVVQEHSKKLQVV